MSYTAEISRDHPTAFLFVIDQSYSMGAKLEGGRSSDNRTRDRS